MQKQLMKISKEIIERSQKTRELYLSNIQTMKEKSKDKRFSLACGNLAHGLAACCTDDKKALMQKNVQNVAILNSYNDVLSAHTPYESYPAFIKEELKKYNHIGQVAAGIPAMCDGVTQGQVGMELSIYSRDVIAMSVAIGLAHNMFDKAIYLGVCDKIVPGLVIGALAFGHLPSIFVPSGPMSSGLPNKEKVRIRQLYVEGKTNKEELLKAEMQSYHSAGTCTFYGTANTNQIMLEALGLQMPGSSFVSPESEKRRAFNRLAVNRLAHHHIKPIGELINEKSFVNAIVLLLATGGSTNLTLHLIAMAKACGIILNWDDFARLSEIVPLLSKVYPSSEFDINDFENNGSTAFVMKSLLGNGLLHHDVHTVMSTIENYTKKVIINEKQEIEYITEDFQTNKVIAKFQHAFNEKGGINVVTGNLGRAIVKVSALKEESYHIQAPAIVFENQDDVLLAFKQGKLNKDCIVVLRYQGPQALGMPELHQLMPALGVLLDKGFKIALITDGRLSGASGKVLAALHLTPEALNNETLAKVQTGDLINLNTITGEITLLIGDDILASRIIIKPTLDPNYYGFGRELFQGLRMSMTDAEKGAASF